MSNEKKDVKLKTFTDKDGRKWKLHVDGRVVCDYEEQTGIDLFASLTEKGLAGPMPGVKNFYILLYLAASPIDDGMKKVDENEFRASVYGEALEEAWSALTEALYSFFPKLRILGGLVDQLLKGQGGNELNQLLTNLGNGKTSSDAPPSQE